MPCWLRRLSAEIVFGAHVRLHQGVDGAGLETQHLGVLAGDDLDDHAIEIRQRVAGLVLPPVVLVSGQREALARHVLGQDERTEPRHGSRGRLQTPGVAKRA